MSQLVTIVTESLRNSLQTIYTATYSTEKATYISICNTYNIPVSVYLFVVPSGASVPTGALFFGSQLGANGTIIFNEKYLRANDTLQGYASVDNAVIIATDIIR